MASNDGAKSAVAVSSDSRSAKRFELKVTLANAAHVFREVYFVRRRSVAKPASPP